MNILVIDGHPNAGSLCAALADRYRAGAGAAGADVTVLAVRDMDFDPVLRLGYQGTQPTEDDVTAARAALDRADHVCVVTPVWWGALPALLKGFCDRVLERGWAFRYTPRGLPDGLLAGRSADVLMTADSPRWYLRLIQGDPAVKALVRSTLRFCGLKPVRLTRFLSVHAADDAARAAWLQRAEDAGARAARRPRPRTAKRPAPPPAEQPSADVPATAGA